MKIVLNSDKSLLSKLGISKAQRPHLMHDGIAIRGLTRHHETSWDPP